MDRLGTAGAKEWRSEPRDRRLLTRHEHTAGRRRIPPAGASFREGQPDARGKSGVRGGSAAVTRPEAGAAQCRAVAERVGIYEVRFTIGSIPYPKLSAEVVCRKSKSYFVCPVAITSFRRNPLRREHHPSLRAWCRCRP